jgi:hypothetical protein
MKKSSMRCFARQRREVSDQRQAIVMQGRKHAAPLNHHDQDTQNQNDPQNFQQLHFALLLLSFFGDRGRRLFDAIRLLILRK